MDLVFVTAVLNAATIAAVCVADSVDGDALPTKDGLASSGVDVGVAEAASLTDKGSPVFSGGNGL